MQVPKTEMRTYLCPAGILQTPRGELWLWLWKDKGLQRLQSDAKNPCMHKLVHNGCVSKSQAQEYELKKK